MGSNILKKKGKEKGTKREKLETEAEAEEEERRREEEEENGPNGFDSIHDSSKRGLTRLRC
jgi:hypothetical protein